MTPPPPPPADLLVEHAAFLRALARRLVRDEHVAEDMVQEAYLTVLRRPPPPHVGARAWLGGIVRHLSLHSLRSRRRRAGHEARAEPPREQDPAGDVVARLEVQQRLAAAVRALPEPGRTAIVLRYYDGLTPTEIAARLDVSVRTVETRLRRARMDLRDRLDRETRGGRRTWMLALAPLALTPHELAAVLAGTSAAATLSSTTATSTVVGAHASTAAAALAGVTLMTAKTAALLAPLLAAAAFALGRVTAPEPGPATAAAPRAAPEPESAPQVRLGANAAEVVALKQQILAERGRREQAEAALASLEAAATRAAKAAGTTATAAGKASPDEVPFRTFVVPGIEKPLAAADWAAAGEAISKMVPLMTELTDAIREGGQIPPSAGEIQRWNGPLVTQALTLSQQGVPGTGVNGAFTHPAVQANLIRATLAHAGLPLTANQESALDDLGTRFSDEDARRIAGYGPGTLGLQKLIEEAGLKDRMYAEVDELLTPDQREALHPAGLRGRMSADLFSSGLVWLQVARPLPYKDASSLTASFLAQLGARDEMKGLSPELREDVAGYWARGFSSAYLRTPKDALWDLRMMPVAHVRTAADQALKALRYVQERAGQDPEVAKMLAEAMTVWVPVYEPEDE